MIAGFERPDEGRVDSAAATSPTVPPNERDVNTVFQDYALFPHMSVRERGVRPAGEAGVGKEERRQRAERGARARRLAATEAPPGAALGRPAPARGAGARPRQLADACCSSTSRSVRSTSSSASRCSRAGHPARGRHHVRLRDPRPGGGALHGDRIVVMPGRIEQVGTPAEVYSGRAPSSSRASSGVSNMVELDGQRFTIRPEKVRILEDAESANGLHVEEGRIARRVVRRHGHPLRGGAGSGRRASGRPPEPRDVLAGGARAEGSTGARRLARRARVRDPGLAGSDNPGGGTKLTGHSDDGAG